MKSTIIWDILVCSLSKVNQRIRGTYRLHIYCSPPAVALLSFSAFLNVKVEVICSLKISFDFQWTTLCYVPEDSTFQSLQYSQEAPPTFPYLYLGLHNHLFPLSLLTRTMYSLIFSLPHVLSLPHISSSLI
jgi:hypothetical protein